MRIASSENKTNSHRTRGQVAVIVALIMVLLLLFTALMVDGANAYQQRRLCQNAADSASLAAAVEMTAIGTTNQRVMNTAVEYVRQHIGQPAQFEARYVDSSGNKLNTILSFGAASAPPSTASGVWVYAQNRYSLFMGRLAGQSEKNSSAEASSQVGGLGTLSADGGGFPIAIPKNLLAGVQDGQLLRIWDDAKISMDSDGSNMPIGGTGNRGWLDLDFVYNMDATKPDRIPDPDPNAPMGGGDNRLEYYVDNSYQNSLFAGPDGSTTAGDFIQGETGTKASAIQAVEDQVGTYIVLPIYDNYYTGAQMTLNTGVSGFTPGQEFFHIIGFARFLITSVNATGNPKYFTGSFQSQTIEGQTGGGLSTSVAGAIRSVSMTR